jgi:putative inorganic carbon (hco3(-)) transporter
MGIKNILVGDKSKYTVLYSLIALYIGMNCVFVYFDFYWVFLLPVLLVIMFLYFYSLDKILLLITLATPLAVNIADREFRLGVSIPTEPLMFGVLVVFLLKLILDKNLIDKKILKHPVTIIVFIQLAWIFITSITSHMPLVSFKFLLARLWFVIPFYLLGVVLFKNIVNVRRFIWFYTVPLLVVIGYTIYNHSLLSFEKLAGHYVMEPFYNDHTAYGAILALFIPMFCGFILVGKYSKFTRFISIIVLAILTIALALSYCRAAWVSLAVAIVVFILVLLRIRFKWVALGALILASMIYMFQNEILERMESNKKTKTKTYSDQIRSISNISTDDSNLERLNRWHSAIRMWEERPVFGFGPGTYQFVYAPFQRSEEKSLISTNSGERGNAHSEYLGPLSEQGLPGMLIVISLVVATAITALRVYRRSGDKEVRILSLAAMLGLTTYFVHGMMNNFLDTDKASVPVWGFIAFLVAMDLYYVKPGTAGTDSQVADS